YHVKATMGNVQFSPQSDRPWWTKTENRKFSVKSAWELLRYKEDKEVRFNRDCGGGSWPTLMALLETYKLEISCRVVRWTPPPEGWLKCNIDGASKGNPGPSSVAFCIRNKEGDMLVAKGVQMMETTNLKWKEMAVKLRRRRGCPRMAKRNDDKEQEEAARKESGR
ncbi:hypothetical protein HAX54_005735, partial [Datura stramonium]|nr:hypothetical protein [Datura stramonium]